MKMEELFRVIEQAGALSVSTVDGETVHARYINFFGHDDDGIYFMTMTVKPFYKQLVRNPSVALSGIYPSGARTDEDEHGMPIRAPGFTLRVSGRVRELTDEEVQKKARDGSKGFSFAEYDRSRYPLMRVFCVHRAKGEVFDFDFQMKRRDHKLLRKRFAYGGESVTGPGCRITAECNACGNCMNACTFKAIVPGEPYRIVGERCDECGNCILVCSAGAIEEPRAM